MTDIIERLRATGGKGQGGQIRAEAADEIERLRGTQMAQCAKCGSPKLTEQPCPKCGAGRNK